MKCILVALVLLLGSFNTIEAINYDSLRPKFNYAILRELKNSGERDEKGQPVGRWIEYSVDSGARKEYIEQRDVGNNLYPPNKWLILKWEGEFVQGKKSGLWNCYRTYDSRQPLKWDLMESCTYVQGEMTGPFRVYYSSGQLEAEYNLLNGKNHGPCRRYALDGKLRETLNYANGEAEGHKERYGSNGVLIWSGELHEGYYNGIIKEFYYNGQLRTVTEYKNGAVWNVLEAYSRYGTALDKGTLKEGTGVYYLYNEAGARIESVEFQNGILEGTFRTYFADGKVENECLYRNDTLTGVYKEFYPEGGLMHLKVMAKGVVEGPVLTYYKSGKLKSENIFRNGVLWATVYANDPQGKRIDCGNVKMGSGAWIIYDDTGRVSQKRKYLLGVEEGITETFYANGKTESTLNYLGGMAHGEGRNYDALGHLEYLYQYNEGLLDGPAFHYYSNGKIYEELYFYRDRLWALISIRDSNGRMLKPGTLKNGCGKVNGYYPDGALYSNTEVLHGMYHGKGILYYADGKKSAELQYFQDQLIGTQREFWRNGTLAAQRVISPEGKEQKLEQYHSNGTLWTTWEYEDGLLWDVPFNNDAKGSPHELGTFKNGTGTLLRYDEKDSVIYTYEFINGSCLNCYEDEFEFID